MAAFSVHGTLGTATGGSQGLLLRAGVKAACVPFHKPRSSASRVCFSSNFNMVLSLWVIFPQGKRKAMETESQVVLDSKEAELPWNY